jgi:TIR domain/Domain of unknown function (DUF4352)
MAHDLFISYSSKDKPTADAVCARLEAHGIRCWIAPRDVLPSDPYGEAIINAIQQSRLMVLVFSGHSNRSPQVMREVERAVSKAIPVLPFRIEDVPLSPSMEYFISAPHWLDAMTGPLEEHLHRLAATATVILDKGEPGAERAVPAPPVPTVRPPAAPVPPPAPKNRLPLVPAGIALLILVLGGAWGLFSVKNRGAGDRQRAGAQTQPAPSSARAGQEAGASPTAPVTVAPEASEAHGSPPVATRRGTVGDELSDGKWRFQVLDVKQVSSYRMERTTETDYAAYHASAELNNQTFVPKPGNTLLMFHCRVSNAMNEKQTLWHYDTDTAVLDHQGESHPPIAFDMRGDTSQSEPLQPGSKLDFAVLFAVPRGTKAQELVFTLKTIDDKEGTDVHVLL